MKDIFSLEGRLALLAGGGGDISIAVARGFAEKGARLILCDSSTEHLEKARSVLGSEGIAVLETFVGSITDPDFIRSMADEIDRRFSTPDILFNSAAITYRKPVSEMSAEEWKNIVDVNLNGAYYLIREFGLRMCERRSGKIIQVLSTGAYRFGANFVAYGATKAAASALIKGLSIEWAPCNIHVNGIAPSATVTNFTRDYYAQYPEKMEATRNNHPYKRLGTPEDCVGAAIYLASDASDFVNGDVIIIDSGKTVK
ncbi:MAG: SDR family oxidoreductase [Spirochaetales bacterium]|nr:SDR family oxidoreductase [Spirochaetales bacterium]